MSDTVKDWKKRARKFQEFNYGNLGDRIYDEIDKSYLKQKVGLGFFGCPRVPVFGNLVYDDEQVKTIEEICNKILLLVSAGNTLKIAFVYVVFRLKGKDGKEGVQPLCKICIEQPGTDVFIDPKCRVYKSWEDYLEKNKLPRCYMCYPNHGKYSDDSGIVDIKFGESPECDLSSNILTGLDITSTVLAVGATGVTVASLAFPIATPFLMGAFGTLLGSGTYDISRNAFKLYDIKSHSGSLGLGNAESRSAWLNIAGTTVGMAAIGTTAVAKGIITTGTTLERSSLIALRALNISSIALTGVGVANGLITAVLKLRDGTLNLQDIKEFIQICFFFMNAVVTHSIANRIISDIAESDVEKVFCLVKNTAHCYTKKMIEFKDSSNYHLFRNLLLGCQSRFLPNSIDFNFIEGVSVQVLHCINNLTSNRIDWERFSKQVTQILISVWNKYKDTMLQAMDEVGEVLKMKDWRSAFLQNTNSVTYISPDLAQQVRNTANQTVLRCSNNVLGSKKQETEIIQLGNAFNAVQPGVNEMEYIHKFKFLCEYLIKQYHLFKEQYETKLDNVSSNKEFNHQTFDRAYGIIGTRRDFFFKKAMETLNTEYRIQELLRNYYLEIAEGTIPPPNELSSVDCPLSSLYNFCGPVGKKTFNDEDYFEKARLLTMIDVNPSKANLMKEDELAFILPTPNKQPYKAMLFHTKYVNNCLIGQLLVMKNTGTSDTQI